MPTHFTLPSSSEEEESQLSYRLNGATSPAAAKKRKLTNSHGKTIEPRTIRLGSTLKRKKPRGTPISLPSSSGTLVVTAKSGNRPVAATTQQRTSSAFRRHDNDINSYKQHFTIKCMKLQESSDESDHSSEMERPYAQNLGLPGESQRYLDRPNSEPLRAGDVIEYSHPLFVAGNPMGHRMAQVLNVNPSRDPPLVLDNGEILPADHAVKRCQEYRRGRLLPHPGIFRPIEDFLLKMSALKANEDDLAGFRRQVDRLRKVVDAGNEDIERLVPKLLQGSKEKGDVVARSDDDSDDSSMKGCDEDVTATKRALPPVSTRRGLAKNYLLPSDDDAISSSDSSAQIERAIALPMPKPSQGVLEDSQSSSSDDEDCSLRPKLSLLAKTNCQRSKRFSQAKAAAPVQNQNRSKGSDRKLTLSKRNSHENQSSKKIGKRRQSSDAKGRNINRTSEPFSRPRLSSSSWGGRGHNENNALDDELFQSDDDEIDSLKRKRNKKLANNTGATVSMPSSFYRPTSLEKEVRCETTSDEEPPWDFLSDRRMHKEAGCLSLSSINTSQSPPSRREPTTFSRTSMQLELRTVAPRPGFSLESE